MAKWTMPRNGWYVVRRYKYSFGRNIIDKSMEEFFCPEQRKWLPFVMVAPTTRAIAEDEAFKRVIAEPDEIGRIHTEYHKIPLTVRARRAENVLYRHPPKRRERPVVPLRSRAAQ